MLAVAALMLAGSLAAAADGSQDLTATAPWNATWADSLKRSLFVGYDKFSRPSHHLVATNVSIGFTITHLELDDKTGLMVVHGWMRMFWNDEKLRWNSSEFGGLKMLHVADHEIWQPDVVQYNSASGSQVDQYGNTNCLVSEDGRVIWVPPTKLTSFCNLDLTKWPADEHECSIVFGSWTYDSIQLYLGTNETVDESGTLQMQNPDAYTENSEWELVKVTHTRVEKTYECCPGSIYASITYKITIRRRGGGVRACLLRAPAQASALIALLGHCLPAKTTLAHRLPMAVAPPTILSFTLLFLSSQLPSASNTPDIMMLYTITLYMVCLSSVISLIVLNIVTTTRKTLPWSVRKMLCSQISRLLCLPKLADTSNGEELQGTNVGAGAGNNAEEGAQMITASSASSRDWIALATAIDRICFILLLAVFVVAMILYGF